MNNRCSTCGLCSIYIALATEIETHCVLCQQCRKQEDERQRRDVENILTLRVGTPVYRARYNRIERGEVCHVGRCDIRSNGFTMRNDESGKYLYFAARFGNEWVGQTYQWEWFADIVKARERLVEQIQILIEDHYRDIEHAKALLAAASTLEAVPCT